MFLLNVYTALITLHITHCTSIYNIKISETNNKLNENYIKTICDNKDVICKVNFTNVCAVRKLDNEMDYKDFLNTCYLFVENLCHYPGQEFYIIKSGTCANYLDSRRSDTVSNNTINNGTNAGNITTTRNATTAGMTVIASGKTTMKPILSNDPKPFSILYDVAESFGGFICPLSCPDTYDPVCVNINRQYGMYFKYLTFVNHCHAYLYYCKHQNEFTPPPDVDYEMAVVSKLSWSFCGAQRFLQFSHFTKTLSSFGHYGWLAGDYKYSHIMEPHERISGYG